MNHPQENRARISGEVLEEFRLIFVKGRCNHPMEACPLSSCPSSSLDLVHYLDYYSTIMINLNIHEAKTHLSRYLDIVQKGETILLCKGKRPVPGIRPIPFRQTGRRPIGLTKGEFQVPETFFEELSEETVDLFDG